MTEKLPKFCWFNRQTKTLDTIKTKCYLANMPIALDMPDLDMIIIHRNVGNHKVWSATHVKSGLNVGKGKTLKAAMANAQERLLSYGNDNFKHAVETHIESYPDIYK